ncbi:ATP-binding protein, partial [Arthrospira platensis SPKY1]|nr:ATP-binding protein [Arthrospira platensis SPKY1]
AAQLESAVMNLCINARDAMPAGGRITIEATNLDVDSRTLRPEDLAPGPYVMLAVTDTGSGMDAATLARAFEPFFTTKDAGKGTGLGLSTVYGFVKQSQGHITLQSAHGRGTVVRL